MWEMALPRSSAARWANDGSGGDEATFRAALDYFLGYYRLHKLDHTTVYEGIPEMLARLADAYGGAPPNGAHRLMAVLSNKPVNPSRDIVRALGLGGFLCAGFTAATALRRRSPTRWGCRPFAGNRRGCRRSADDRRFVDRRADRAQRRLVDVRRNLRLCSAFAGNAPPDVLVESPRELGELCGRDAGVLSRNVNLQPRMCL